MEGRRERKERLEKDREIQSLELDRERRYERELQNRVREG
jgi:hypothetical protein